MPEQNLLIEDCTDPLMWYSDKVGDVVPLVREDSECYWSREDAGFLNRVEKKDARIVSSEIKVSCDESNVGIDGHLKDPDEEDINSFQETFESLTENSQYVVSVEMMDGSEYEVSVFDPMCSDQEIRYHEHSSPNPPQELLNIPINEVKSLTFESF